MQKLIILLMAMVSMVCTVQSQNSNNMEKEPEKLAVLWTSGDPEVFDKMVFMYTYNAKKQGWFDEVAFIIWGPSSKLLAETPKFQENIKQMMEIGIKVEACVVCARMYEVDDDLRELGVDVKGMGTPLSDYLKDGWRTLSL